jgi:hypothetical protein
MQDMQPDNMNPAAHTAADEANHDREGAMAKADLHKLANYSIKLFKKLDDEAQLEGWVQAKITKAADYIASVYHYLEYEMEFSDYGAKLDNTEMYNESQKIAIKNKLMEAKSKIAELKKTQAEKMKSKDSTKVKESMHGGDQAACEACGGTGSVMMPERQVPEALKAKVDAYNRKAKAMSAAVKRVDANKNGIPDDEEMEEDFDDKEMKVGDTKKTRTGELTKTSTGVTHKNTSYKDEGDEIASNAKSGKGIKSHAKAQSAAEKKEKAPAQKMSPKSAKTWGMKDSEKFDNRDGAPAKPKKEKEVDETFGQGVYEGNEPKDKPKKGEKVGKEGNAFGKAVRDAKADGVQKGEKIKVGGKEYPVKEAAPSAGMTKKEKSAVVKDAKSGKDIGKPGKSFDKVAKAAGGGEKGTKIAAAAMWKNKAKSIKESLDAMSGMSVEEDQAQAQAGLQALLDYAKQNDPQGLAQAVQQGGQAVENYFKNLANKIPAAPVANAAAPTASPQPKDMPVAGDSATGENIGVVPNPSGATSIDQAKELGSSMPAPAGQTDPIKSSAETMRMREHMARLNQNENIIVRESSEVDQIRALTKRLLG